MADRRPVLACMVLVAGTLAGQLPGWRACAIAQSTFPLRAETEAGSRLGPEDAQPLPFARHQREIDASGFEQPVIEWLSEKHFQHIAYDSRDAAIELATAENEHRDWDGCVDCGCTTGLDCRCAPCQCPVAPAPCIECPHATTLNPYSNIHFFGTLKLDMLFNAARPISAGVPFFLAPDSLVGLDQDTVDIHARQTTLGAAIVGPQMGEFQSGGTVIGMLFNDNVLADKYGFLPLQAFGELKNDDWRFAGGLQFDVFAPGVPTVLPFSALAASGNAGNSFRGQLRLERFVHVASDMQWTLQSALSEPITTTIDPTFGISEDNGWPNVEGRIALGLGEIQGAGLAAVRPFEAGLSGIVGQVRTTPLPPGGRVVADVWGLAVDARWRMSQRFGVAGEVYTGQALGTYNGAILQEVNVETLEGIRTTGGWLEAIYYWTPRLHTHAGYAADDPVDGDVPDSAAALGRTYNSTLYSNLLWEWTPSFRIGFEFTWRETAYKSAANPDNEGAGFHTQFQWAF